MNTLGVAYIICGILYIIACVMDGKDVKPLWRKWVGRKLEKAANYFFPIKYVTETKFVPSPPSMPFERCAYERLDFKAEKLNATHIITEREMLDELSSTIYRREDAIPSLIKEVKSQCIRSICNRIATGGYVTVEEDRESHYPNVLVRAWLYVGKKRDNF